jgi:hypothetical protein
MNARPEITEFASSGCRVARRFERLRKTMSMTSAAMIHTRNTQAAWP